MSRQPAIEQHNQKGVTHGTEYRQNQMRACGMPMHGAGRQEILQRPLRAAKPVGRSGQVGGLQLRAPGLQKRILKPRATAGLRPRSRRA
jgi:hypothetical protein